VEGVEGDRFVATNVAAAVCSANFVDDVDGGCVIGDTPPLQTHMFVFTVYHVTKELCGSIPDHLAFQIACKLPH
jgi:phosphatidylethanolamine-binding protein (PEBP) family uncharacterized protein